MADEVKSADHRRLRRRKPKRGIGLSCRKGTLGLGKDLAVSMLDITEEGASLIVKEELPKGTEVEVTLTGIGVGNRVKVLGIVAWCSVGTSTCAIGVRFRDRLNYVDFVHLI